MGKKILAGFAALGFGLAALIVMMTAFLMTSGEFSPTFSVIAFVVGALAGWYRVMSKEN